MANPKTLARAIQFLESSHDSGGTELGMALEQALNLRRSAGLRSRQVLVITDAQVSDASRILRLCDEEWRRGDRRRVNLLCIDAAPNSFLTLEMARAGGGVAKFISSDPAEVDVSAFLGELLAVWSQPVLAGLRLEVSSPTVHAAGHQVSAGRQGGWSAIDLGDLPAGRAIWVAGRANLDGREPVLFRLVDANGAVVAEGEGGRVAVFANSGIKALFGAERVLGLEFLRLEDQLKASPAESHAVSEQIEALTHELGRGREVLLRLKEELDSLMRHYKRIRQSFESLTRQPAAIRLFKGTPIFRDGRAVLFDSKVPAGSYCWLEVRLANPLVEMSETRIKMIHTVNGQSSTTVELTLGDVLRSGLRYPITLFASEGAGIAVILEDPEGAWVKSAPEIEVWLA